MKALLGSYERSLVLQRLNRGHLECQSDKRKFLKKEPVCSELILNHTGSFYDVPNSFCSLRNFAIENDEAPRALEYVPKEEKRMFVLLLW